MCIYHSYIDKSAIRTLNELGVDIEYRPEFSVLFGLECVLESRNLEAIKYYINYIYSDLMYWGIDIQGYINGCLDEQERKQVYPTLFKAKIKNQDYSERNCGFDYIKDLEIRLSDNEIEELLKGNSDVEIVKLLYNICDGYDYDLMDLTVEHGTNEQIKWVWEKLKNSLDLGK